MNKDKEKQVIVDAINLLIDKLFGAFDSPEKALGKMFSPELSRMFLATVGANYKELLRGKSPVLAMMNEIGDNEVCKFMVASFMQGLLVGHHVGNQSQSLTYCDNIVYEYCQDKGVDFKDAVEEMAK